MRLIADFRDFSPSPEVAEEKHPDWEVRMWYQIQWKQSLDLLYTPQKVQTNPWVALLPVFFLPLDKD